MSVAGDEGRTGAGRVVVVLAALVIVIAGLRVAKEILVPFVVALFLAVISRPPLRWLERRGVPLVVGLPLTALAVLAFLLLMGLLIAASTAAFVDVLPFYQERINAIVARVTSWIAERGVEASGAQIREQLNLGAAMGLVGGLFTALVTALSNMLVVLLITVFILFEMAGFPAKLRALHGEAEAKLEQLAQASRDVQRYLLIKTAVSLATGVLIGLWCLLLGLDFPLLWGLLAFVLNFIPNIGSILAAIPAVLLAVVQLGAGRALAVAAGYVVVNFAVGNIVEPRFMGRSLGLSTLVVFLSLIFWGFLWGPIGMLLSVPLTVSAKILLSHSAELRWVAVLLGPSPRE